MKRLSPLLALILVACGNPRVLPSSQLVASLDEDARTKIGVTVEQYLGAGWQQAQINCADGANKFYVQANSGKVVDIPLAKWQVNLCKHNPPTHWLDANTRLNFEKHGGWELVGVS